MNELIGHILVSCITSFIVSIFAIRKFLIPIVMKEVDNAMKDSSKDLDEVADKVIKSYIKDKR